MVAYVLLRDGLCGMPLKPSVNGFKWNVNRFAFCVRSFRKVVFSMSDSTKKKTSLLPVNIREVEDKITTIRGMEVIADADVAALYGVETRDVNKAVRNNPDKFPQGYMFELRTSELQVLRCKISSTNVSTKTRKSTKVFTERGLYMLATILSGERAREVTFAIIETFYKVRNLKRELLALHSETDKDLQSKKMKHSVKRVRKE